MTQDCQSCARVLMCPNSRCHTFRVQNMLADQPLVAVVVVNHERKIAGLMDYVLACPERPTSLVRSIFAAFYYAAEHKMLPDFVNWFLSVPLENKSVPYSFNYSQISLAAYLYERVQLEVFHAAMDQITLATDLPTLSVRLRNIVAHTDEQNPCAYVSLDALNAAIEEAGGPDTQASIAVVNKMMAIKPSQPKPFDLAHMPVVGGIN